MANGRPHILVVDDDPEVRSLVARYLGAQGFRVTGVANGSGLRSAIGNDQNVRGAWVAEQKVTVEKGKIVNYRVVMRVSFVLK